MMEIASKRYTHDHVSSYKNRGEKLGPSNRFIRAHRANEDRKTSRLETLTKRRGIVLSLVEDQNVSLEEKQKKTSKSNVVKKVTATKGGNSQKENIPQEKITGQITDQRKTMLLKWREQRELKKKAGTATKERKAAFAVRQVQHHDSKPLFIAPMTKKSTKKTPSKKPEPNDVAPVKRVTRSSVKLASKPQAKTEIRKRIPSNRNENRVLTVKKPVAPKKVEAQPTRVTRQSAKPVNSKKIKKTTTQQKQELKLEKKTKEKPSTEIIQPDALTTEKSTPLEKKETLHESFAPPNYQFTAPAGLYSFDHFSKDFKFEPLSPVSVGNFFQVTKYPTPEKCKETITKDSLEFEENDSKSGKKPITGSLSNQECFPPIKQPEAVDQVNDGKHAEEEGKVSCVFFRNLLSSETDKLNELCDKWEKIIESEATLTEEVSGNIRTAIGQAQLLISQRFKQFSGLVDLSEDQSAEKKVTLTDLQGFWDMIYFQVEDVFNKMETLEKQKQNNWILESTTKKKCKKTKKIATKKGAVNPTAKPTDSKSRILEMRTAMRAKMAEKKRQMQAEVVESGENCTYVTVLTPTKIKKSAFSGEIVLTPVRRSLRNTPISQSGTRVTPKVISTPRHTAGHSPGLRLTPEVAVSQEPMDEGDDNPVSAASAGQEIAIHNGRSMADDSDEKCCGPEQKDGGIKEDSSVFPRSTNKRSCLRSSSKKNHQSRVFFQSPPPRAQPIAGGTPTPLALTPEKQDEVRFTESNLTPVAITFESPTDEGNTCSVDAGHTPALKESGQRSLRSRTHTGTPVRRSGRRRNVDTPVERETSGSDSATDQTGSPPGCLDNKLTERPPSSKKKSRRSCRKSTGAEHQEDSFLPVKFILPSTTSEEDSDETSIDPRALLTFTPVKSSSNQLNQSSLTPATRLQALNLNDTPPSDATRRDSVFFAPRCCADSGQPAKDNLICFSPVAE